MNIIWSEFAQVQIEDIFEYYKLKVSEPFAKKLIESLINAPNKLALNPLIGQIEENLKHRKISYRYLVFENYKLIYSVDKNNGYIKITDVFDTRQSPLKIKRVK